MASGLVRHTDMRDVVVPEHATNGDGPIAIGASAAAPGGSTSPRQEQLADRQVAKTAALREEAGEILAERMLSEHRVAVDACVGQVALAPPACLSNPDRADAERAQAGTRNHYAQSLGCGGEFDEPNASTGHAHEKTDKRQDVASAPPTPVWQCEKMNRHERGGRLARGWRAGRFGCHLPPSAAR
jgi:hypothetical protein